jgi:hypothetical protein
MAHGDAREGKWRGNWRMEWVASTLHTTSEHYVSSITTADAHISVASSRLNWRSPADLNGPVLFAGRRNLVSAHVYVESSWNVMAHGDAREGKWRGNCRMEWVASTLHTTSEFGVSSITTADAHISVASSRLNWRLRRFKWTRPFRRKTKSGFCACAITFQTQCNTLLWHDSGAKWNINTVLCFSKVSLQIVHFIKHNSEKQQATTICLQRWSSILEETNLKMISMCKELWHDG